MEDCTLSENNATFYTDVTNVYESYLLGRVLRSQRVRGQAYAAGDTIELAIADVVDWLISYDDRPEKGNLLGKYMLMRQDVRYCAVTVCPIRCYVQVGVTA